MELRVTNLNNSYFIPTIEDFKQGKVKEYYLAASKGTFNPDLPELNISSESNYIWWFRCHNHRETFYEEVESVILNYLKQGRIRVKKDTKETIIVSKKDFFKESITLAEIDCNCNDCFFMKRDLEKYKLSLKTHEKWQLDYYNTIRTKTKDNSKKFEFTKKDINIHYGYCTKLNKDVSFIPNTCQLETQKCFEYRKTHTKNQMEQKEIKVILPEPKYLTKELNHQGNIYLIKLKHQMQIGLINPKVISLLELILEIAGKNKIKDLFSLLEYELKTDGTSIRQELEKLENKIGEPLELINFQYLETPFSNDIISTLTLNPIGRSSVGISYVYKGGKPEADKAIVNIMRNILTYYPLCVKEENLLASVVEIEEKKDTFDKFKTEKVLYNNIALFEEQRRTIGEILKEAQIEVLDFIYV